MNPWEICGDHVLDERFGLCKDMHAGCSLCHLGKVRRRWRYKLDASVVQYVGLCGLVPAITDCTCDEGGKSGEIRTHLQFVAVRNSTSDEVNGLDR